jgi:hypothetical protein
MESTEMIRTFVTITSRALNDAQIVIDTIKLINAILKEAIDPQGTTPPPSQPEPPRAETPTTETATIRSIQIAIDDVISILQAGRYESEAARSWLLWGDWRRPRQRERVLREARRPLLAVREAHPNADALIAYMIALRVERGRWETRWEAARQEH